jgi:hypothetical protein
MRCRACHARMQPIDNYCRKCGAAVEYIDVPVVREELAGPVAQLRAAALPVATRGAAVVVAGTLLRFALRSWFEARAARRSISLLGHDGGTVEETLIYRRVRQR